jgi:hypothetical protein
MPFQEHRVGCSSAADLNTSRPTHLTAPTGLSTIYHRVMLILNAISKELLQIRLKTGDAAAVMACER